MTLGTLSNDPPGRSRPTRCPKALCIQINLRVMLQAPPPVTDRLSAVWFCPCGHCARVTTGPKQALPLTRSAWHCCILTAFVRQMDTVGDAYVVVGFLRDASPDQAGTGISEREVDEHCFVPIGPGPGPSGGGDAGSDDSARATDHAAAAAAVCEDMLAVARAMILALRDYRLRTGSGLHCRIGVALGDVVAGVLGHLQPRCAEGRGWGQH